MELDFTAMAVGDIVNTEFTSPQGTINLILMKSENVRTAVFGLQGEGRMRSRSFVDNTGTYQWFRVFPGTVEDYASTGNFIAYLEDLKDAAVIILNENDGIGSIVHRRSGLTMMYTTGRMEIPLNDDMYTEDFEINGLNFTYVQSGGRRYLALLLDERNDIQSIILDGYFTKEQFLSFARDIVVLNIDSEQVNFVETRHDEVRYNDITFDEAKSYVPWDSRVFDRFGWIDESYFSELFLLTDWGQPTRAQLIFDIDGIMAVTDVSRTTYIEYGLRGIEDGPTQLDVLIYFAIGFSEIVSDQSGRLYGIRQDMFPDENGVMIRGTLVLTITEDEHGYVSNSIVVPEILVSTEEIIRDITG
jgi:hypothetical protein